MESIKNTINRVTGSNETSTQSTQPGESAQTVDSGHSAPPAASAESGHTAQSGVTGATAHDKTTHSGESDQKSDHVQTPVQNDQTTHSDESDHKSHHIHNPLHHNSHESGSDDASNAPTSDHQNASQGPDPALVGDANPEKKLTGSGVDGSHSAFFGLTPDGHKHEDTSHVTTAPKPAHGDKGKSDKSDKNDKNDDGSRAPTGNSEIKEQMNAPDTGAKGLERKEPAPTEASSDGKPGAGLSGMEQGSGAVGN